MPLMRCKTEQGVRGWKYGERGKCYADKRDAVAQGVAIAKSSGEKLHLAFCPTGKGGGVDNSCGRGDGIPSSRERTTLVISGVTNNRKSDLEVFYNPTRGDLQGLLNRNDALRGLYDKKTGKLIVWPAGDAIHYQVAVALKYKDAETSGGGKNTRLLKIEMSNSPNESLVENTSRGFSGPVKTYGSPSDLMRELKLGYSEELYLYLSEPTKYSCLMAMLPSSFLWVV